MAAKSRKHSTKFPTLHSLLYRGVPSTRAFPDIIPYGISGPRVLLVRPTTLPRCTHGPYDRCVEGIMVSEYYSLPMSPVMPH